MVAKVAAKKKKVKQLSDTFAELHADGIISSSTVQFTQSRGFTSLSPVQKAVLPLLIKENRDVVVEACTGSGKTLAFLIPLLERIIRRNDISSSGHRCSVLGVCLSPTRELASQIDQELTEYLKFVERTDGRVIKTILFTGGKSVSADVRLVFDLSDGREGVLGVITSTPGRLSHLIGLAEMKEHWQFRDLEMLILDEADRLLQNKASFETQLSSILAAMPKQRRTGLFSATLPADMEELIRTGLRDPIYVKIKLRSNDQPSTEAPSVPESLTNRFVILPRHQKVAFLVKFLLAEVCRVEVAGEIPRRSCIIFFLTCSAVLNFYKVFSELLASVFPDRSISLNQLSGRMTHAGRKASYKQFCGSHGRANILLATDVAARGLDFKSVDWIVQFDAPQDPAFFIHRIGRTARAGKRGESLLFLTEAESSYIEYLRKKQLELHPLEPQGGLGQRIRDHDLTAFLSLPESEHAHTLNQEKASTPVDDDLDGWYVAAEEFALVWQYLRRLNTADRDFLRIASAAFVSIIRAYKEHHLPFLFPSKEFEVGELATSFGLLRLPRVKEILGRSVEGFTQSAIDPKCIRFRDPAKQKAFEEREAEVPHKKAGKSDRRMAQANAIEKVKRSRTRSEKRRTKRKVAVEEWDDLAKEERLYKKWKRGKISNEEYNKLLCGDDD